MNELRARFGALSSPLMLAPFRFLDPWVAPVASEPAGCPGIKSPSSRASSSEEVSKSLSLNLDRSSSSSLRCFLSSEMRVRRSRRRVARTTFSLSSASFLNAMASYCAFSSLAPATDMGMVRAAAGRRPKTVVAHQPTCRVPESREMSSAPPREEEEETVMASVIKEFQGLKDKLKNEDQDYSPFLGLEKNAVMHEARMFNEPEMVTKHPRRCRKVLTKLLYLLLMGNNFSGSEATEVFFGVTKLFQSLNPHLRRMMYLFIKEVAESTASEEVVIVVASLTKDMNSKEDLFRANAIRVLTKIIDSSMLGQLERYIRQAIVDKTPMVASAALVAGLRFIKGSPEIVRRWVSEVQEASTSPHETVQYHAMCLLHQIRAHDRLAVGKLVTQYWRSSGLQPLALCQLVRYSARLLVSDPGAVDRKACFAFMESCLRHKSDMVVFEAARAVVSLPDISATDAFTAVTVLRLLLSSPKSVLRFAAVRTLSWFAQRHPEQVAQANQDLEQLISDDNRSVATLAITTLLKTGSRSSVDSLMKEIHSFIADISDDFKRMVVRAVRELCIKYPDKFRMLFMFLTNVLREEGSFELKSEVVDTFLHLMSKLDHVREHGYFHLCELIEDCEYTTLSTRVLHVLGERGPDSPVAPRLVRSISNRLILENAWVRAAAVSALAKFAARLPALRSSVLVLLRRSLLDEDDEVRDRAALALRQLVDERRAARIVELPRLPGSVDALR
eukprot:CAMPEP_0196771302 /NCGR_PEP_ID=MMETSP1104-20130614/1604_1 /TAXON_ID=33652 /ORGANISM="Cafeteria sp., Strain Caron Lab Isolate" /LENGTH=729 /DNA_ID=CAMNT_0042141421 /DNA_START=336 /DNA_END=2522 /DNA_ORIENTATION=+